MLLECVSVSTPIKKKVQNKDYHQEFSINQSRGTAFLPYSFLQPLALIWEGQLLLHCYTSKYSHALWLKQNCCQCISPFVSHLHFDCSLCFSLLAFNSLISFLWFIIFLNFSFLILSQEYIFVLSRWFHSSYLIVSQSGFVEDMVLSPWWTCSIQDQS